MILKEWNFYIMTFMIFILTEYSAIFCDNDYLPSS